MWTRSLLAGAILLGAATAQAQDANPQPAGNGGYQASYYPENYNNGIFYPSTELRALPGARATSAAAWAQFRRAESDLDNAVEDVRRQFKRSTELKEALAEERAAWEALNDVRDEALADLRKDENYRAALKLRKKLSEQIEARRDQGPATPEEMRAMASVKLSYSSLASAMEAAAIAAEPRVKSAKQRLIDASTRVAELQVQFDEALRSSTTVLVARKTVADAKIAALAADALYIEAANVANVAIDFTYRVYDRPRPYAVYSPYYYPYSSGYGLGYPVGYPYMWNNR